MSKPAVEIERKFLVAMLPDLSGLQPDPIRQGYLTLPQDSVQVRLRAKGARHYLTVKGPGLLVRAEHETEIPAAAFAALWPATDGGGCARPAGRGICPAVRATIWICSRIGPCGWSRLNSTARRRRAALSRQTGSGPR